MDVKLVGVILHSQSPQCTISVSVRCSVGPHHTTYTTVWDCDTETRTETETETDGVLMVQYAESRERSHHAFSAPTAATPPAPIRDRERSGERVW